MNEWANGPRKPTRLLVPDAMPFQPAGMGMLVRQDRPGLRERSWRYSMLVRDDGGVEKRYHRAGPGGRPGRGVGRRHDALVREARGQASPNQVANLHARTDAASGEGTTCLPRALLRVPEIALPARAAHRVIGAWRAKAGPRFSSTGSRSAARKARERWSAQGARQGVHPGERQPAAAVPF